MTRHKFINFFSTSYPREMYYALRKVAGKKGLSLQDTVREAVKFYLNSEGETIPDEVNDDITKNMPENRRKLYE